jgi:nucleoside-diphosphate-sugar epimerase
MHILITGAGGFIGRHLVNTILENSDASGLTRLTAMDLNLDALGDHPLMHKLTGSFTDDTILDAALSVPADQVFHLASVPSGAAESNHTLGMSVNIDGTIALLDRLKAQGNTPTMVFASSIAVFGKPAVNEVNDDTLPTPNLSYGSQKVIGEVLVADYVRRGWIRGCSVRLPGIIARPPEPNGAVSIFFSDLVRNLSQGQPFTCPVSITAMSWLMSVTCCVDNLLHAATLAQDKPHTWTLPAMHIAIGELVNELDELFPDLELRDLISYEPDPWVEENFGSYPPIKCLKAEAAGFHHDGSALDLVANAMKTLNPK